jgi:hypothetical protein
MKASDTPKIDAAWWRKNKPSTLKSTGLGDAMADYQVQTMLVGKAVEARELNVATGLDAFEKAETKLKALETAAKKARDACDSGVMKGLHQGCSAVLGKLIKPMLSDERKDLEKRRDAYVSGAEQEARKLKAACQALLVAVTKLSNGAVAQLDDVARREDDLSEIREAAAKSLRTGTPVAQQDAANARQIAGSIDTALRDVKDNWQKTKAHVSKFMREEFNKSLAQLEPSLERVRDSIDMPLDVVEFKVIPQLEEAAKRAAKALKSIEDLISGIADEQQAYVGLLTDFVERSILKSDAISGNLRGAGGKLDGADMALINFSEAKPGARGSTPPANIEKLLEEAKKEIGLCETSLTELRKSLDSFSRTMPPFVEPKNRKFQKPMQEFLALNQGTETDAAEIKKLKDKAAKVGKKLQDATKKAAA